MPSVEGDEAVSGDAAPWFASAAQACVADVTVARSLRRCVAALGRRVKVMIADPSRSAWADTPLFE